MTCPDCRAAPGEKCAPDRAGRSQLHRGRIRDAEQAMQVPVHRILPSAADRHFMPLDPDCADTLVVVAAQGRGRGAGPLSLRGCGAAVARAGTSGTRAGDRAEPEELPAGLLPHAARLPGVW
ncbi:zinc finger domain-containing protein [Streptomyces sp. enrichment culture]|uniref:zinc finger domain-containing protein n=1 Tax=Streptomyces sp. enrichment culture TaxID=1795815 RepID=UPI003F56FFB8